MSVNQASFKLWIVCELGFGGKKEGRSYFSILN